MSASVMSQGFRPWLVPCEDSDGPLKPGVGVGFSNTFARRPLSPPVVEGLGVPLVTGGGSEESVFMVENDNLLRDEETGNELSG